MTDTAPRLAPAGGEAADRPEAVDVDSVVGDHRDRPEHRDPPDGGLGLLVAGAVAFVAARPLVDNSFLTHLATGRIFLADGFPDTNPFLYSSTDFPVPSWLWSLLLGVTDAVAGGAGIRILTAVLAGVLGLVIVRLTRPDPGASSEDFDAARVSNGGRSLLSVVVPAACALVTLMPFLNARPQLPGYLLLAATVLVVNERRSPLWLILVFALWLNIHGTWIYGMAVLGLLLAVQAIDDRRIRPVQFGCVGAALVGVVLGGTVGPEPFRLIGLPFEQFGDERARRAIASYVEWQPSGWDHPLTWMLIAMGLVAVFGAVRSRRWGVLVGSVGMVAMGLSAGRLLPLAAITLIPWVSDGIGQLTGTASMALPDGRRSRILSSVGIGLGALSLAWIVLTPAYDLTTYPVAAVDWLAGRGLVGSDEVKVASHDYVGNYLDWRFGDRANTFVDDRSGVDAILDYATLKDFDQGWQAALSRTDADVIVWRTDEKLTTRLDPPAWFRAGEFGEFSVFCRSSIADRCS